MVAKRTRKGAADAARKLLEDRVTLVADLAEAGSHIDALEARMGKLQEEIAAARNVYAEQYRQAVDGGWTDAQLDEVGCSIERIGVAAGSRSRTRRRRTMPTPEAPPVVDQHPEMAVNGAVPTA